MLELLVQHTVREADSKGTHRFYWVLLIKPSKTYLQKAFEDLLCLVFNTESFLIHPISNCPGGGFGGPGGGFGGPGGGFFSTGTSSGFATASTCSKTTPRTTQTTPRTTKNTTRTYYI